MSTLRSALDELRGDDLEMASDEELGEGLVELERASRVIDAERSRRLIEVERRGAWSVDGHLSVVSWLAAKLRVGFEGASQQVKRSRALHHMPRTAEASGEGDLSSEAVDLLVAARETAPQAFMEAEPMLVEAAVALPTRDLRTAIGYWRQVADAEGSDERERRQHDGRHLHVSPLLSGMVRVDGDLDPESGQTVITALRAVQDAWAKHGEPDVRTAPQRRADALVALCRSWLDRSDRPEIAGERPHIVVTVDLETLEGRAAGKRSELEDAGSITLGDRSALRVRRGRLAHHHGGRFRTPGCRAKDTRRARGAQTRAGAPRRWVSIPRVRPASSLVRRAPRSALGPGR